jgi:hypothetical protein
MAQKRIYLLDPYNEVIKVTANSDAVFRLDINKTIIYTEQQLWDRMDAVAFLNEWEDNITRLSRYPVSFMNNIADLNTAIINNCNLIQWNNSYSDQVCGGIARLVRVIFKHYVGDDAFYASGVGHAFNVFTDGFLDQINKHPTYKAKYVMATFAELQADKTLYTEALRNNIHQSTYTYTNYITNGSITANAILNPFISTVNNVYMRLPAGSNLILPVHTANVPKTEIGTSFTMWANGVVTIPSGVTGVVEMPFKLLQITGTGTVVVDSIEYTLPTDEAALKDACQNTAYDVEKWIAGFTIISSSSAIVAEFLVNHYKVHLFHNNLIDYTITSGSISIERVATDIPVPTCILSIDKKDSGSFTLDYTNYFTNNKSFRIPVHGIGLYAKCIWFLPNTYGKYAPVQTYLNLTEDLVIPIVAETAGYDQCFTSRLMPKNETFSESIEMSFVSVDGEDAYYTLDESTPTTESTKYTVPFTLTETTTIKWICARDEYNNSHVLTRVVTKV